MQLNGEIAILDFPRVGRPIQFKFILMINLKSTKDLETIETKNLLNVKGGISNSYSMFAEDSGKKDVDSTSDDSYKKD